MLSSTTGSTEFTLRPARPEDLAGIAAVINASSADVLGTRRALIDRAGKLRQARYVPEHTAQIVVTTPTNEIVGYHYFVDQPPHIVSEIGCAVHPAYRGRGIGTALLHWAEQHARELLPLAPDGAKIVIQSNVFDGDRHTQALLGEAGFTKVRQWIHLAIELSAPPPPPAWPDGVAVRLMDPQIDWPTVGAALEEAFADHWGSLADSQEAHESEEGAGDDSDDEEEDDPYSNSRGLCFVAMSGDQVAGSCLCNAQTVEWPDAGKVGSLSIRRPYRQRGIARALLSHAFGEFYRRGTRRVITDTDAESFTGADRLYQQIGMSIFRREFLYEKAIRPGQELRVLSVDSDHEPR